jgi:hypothetical protein
LSHIPGSHDDEPMGLVVVAHPSMLQLLPSVLIFR